MVKVLLADDSATIRKVIIDLLTIDPGIKVIAECGSFAETIRLAATLHPDVILMDIHLSDERVFTHQQVKISLIGIPILAMSVWKDDETKTIADLIGAERFLDKPNLADDLIPAIRQCSNQKPIARA